MRKTRYGVVLALVAVVVTLVFPAALLAQESGNATDALQNLAARIAEKRATLEALSDELDIAKTQYNEQLRSLATQTADVQALINREELRLAQLNGDIAEIRAEIEHAESGSIDVSPIVDVVIERLRRHIEEGIPFQTTQRLETLNTIERLMADGSLGAQTALTRLWNIVDTEFRLVGDSGIYRQRIELEGESRLAEVARLGMVLLYFRTLEGDVGMAVPEAGGWEYRPVEARTRQEEISALFEGLRRNLRQGFFTVPNPYYEG